MQSKRNKQCEREIEPEREKQSEKLLKTKDAVS